MHKTEIGSFYFLLDNKSEPCVIQITWQTLRHTSLDVQKHKKEHWLRHIRNKVRGVHLAPRAETIQPRPIYRLRCWYNIDTALIAQAIRTGWGAPRRGRDCVKARHPPWCSHSTTHFNSTANTIVFVSVHYPQMPDHCRETPPGVLDWTLSPTNRCACACTQCKQLNRRTFCKTKAKCNTEPFTLLKDEKLHR